MLDGAGDHSDQQMNKSLAEGWSFGMILAAARAGTTARPPAGCRCPGAHLRARAWKKFEGGLVEEIWVWDAGDVTN